ncbi:HAMP domain-containing histidine kinase [Campylobacter sp. FMV-PI01]|uniref:histidine kinase n=2 Tax=Campylobacter portucalensis TaxID=2608384 RepID=A0A6L5WG86_9BACT|nr:HAMP domain-containing histidine kinase [Campylobacter portucalensis]
MFYKDFFFQDDKLYYLIVAKKLTNEKLNLITCFMLFATILVVFLIMYFTHQSTIKSHLEQKDKMTTFFNDAMHELKTPLGVAMLNLSMMEFKNKNTHRIKSALKQMMITYEDIEYFIKNSKINFTKKVINLSSFLALRISFINAVAKSKNIKIIAHIKPNLYIFMSEIEATRLIDNTISNAIKYSNEGQKILINLHLENGMIVFVVKDFGIGIKDTSKIWQRYVREDRINGGFGLGLNIVLKICQKYAISKNVKSIYKQGSTFTYAIPAYKEKILDNIS